MHAPYAFDVLDRCSYVQGLRRVFLSTALLDDRRQDLNMAANDSDARSASLEKTGVELMVEEASMKPDVAYGGEDELPPPPDLSEAQIKALYRKIDLRLMPILTLMYLCSFLDRGNIGESPIVF